MQPTDWFLYTVVLLGLGVVAAIAYCLGRADGRAARAREDAERLEEYTRSLRRLPRDAHGRWLNADGGRRA